MHHEKIQLWVANMQKNAIEIEWFNQRAQKLVYYTVAYGVCNGIGDGFDEKILLIKG